MSTAKTTITAKQLKEITGKPVKKGCLKFVNDRLAGAGQVDHEYIRELVEEFEGSSEPAVEGAGATEPAAENATGTEPDTTGEASSAGESASTKANRFTVYEQSATAVLRAMGKAGGFTPKGAHAALVALGAEGLSMTTVRIQLLAGKKGQRGEPAKLTQKQLQELTKLAKAAESKGS